MNRKKKENIFFMEKRKIYFSNQKKKKEVEWKNKCLLYIDMFFRRKRRCLL